MKTKGVLYIIIGLMAIILPILAFKTITSKFGDSTEPVLIGFRLVLIFGGMALVASGIGNVIEAKKRKQNKDNDNKSEV